MQQRLQKILSSAGVCSRRSSEKLLEEGRVTVNGLTASVGMSADPDNDDIRVDGRTIAVITKHTYIMLNKPCGYVTTLSDEKGRKNVGELVKEAGVRLYPVGRLDLNSQGLLIMTDDGELANAMMHPSHNVDKVYRVEVEGDDFDRAIEILHSPIVLDGRPIVPAQVEVESIDGRKGILLVTIHEGRNRQVRRMCEAASLWVNSLMRISEGPLTLGRLASGKWRYLNEKEISDIKASLK